MLPAFNYPWFMYLETIRCKGKLSELTGFFAAAKRPVFDVFLVANYWAKAPGIFNDFQQGISTCSRW